MNVRQEQQQQRRRHHSIVRVVVAPMAADVATITTIRVVMILLFAATILSSSIMSFIPTTTMASAFVATITTTTTITTTDSTIRFKPRNQVMTSISSFSLRTPKIRTVTSSSTSPQQAHAPCTTMMMLPPSTTEVLPIITTTTTAAVLLLLPQQVVSYVLTILNELYTTYPYLSAFLTCSGKAGLADYLVQRQQQQQQSQSSSCSCSIPRTDPNTTTIQINRTIGFILYGGFYQGLFQQYMYGTVFPRYFEDDTTTMMMMTDWIGSLGQQVFIDMFVLGPFLCLPISYIVQSICTSMSSSPPATVTSPTSSTTNRYWSHNVAARPKTESNKYSSSTATGSEKQSPSNHFPPFVGWNQHNMIERDSIDSWMMPTNLYSNHDHQQRQRPLPLTYMTTANSYHHTSSFMDGTDDDNNNRPSWFGSIPHTQQHHHHHPGPFTFWKLRLDDRTTSIQDQQPQPPQQDTIHYKIQHGVEQYMYDVTHQKILLKYWILWIPIKCITFTIVPHHLRIAFIAIVSFFWMIILSSSSTAATASSPPSTSSP
jgi:Mpv17 / PMP22 family